MIKKSFPWIDEADSEFYGCNDFLENLSIINYRNSLDNHFGSMISPEVVWSKGWDVGVISCGDSDAEDRLLEKLFDQVFRGFGDVIPIRNCKKDGFDRNSELENFYPPLISTVDLSYRNYVRIRCGMIPIYSQNYFIIPKDRGSCYLNVASGYHLFCGDENMMKEVFGVELREVWEHALSDSFPHAHMCVDLLRAARMYGYV